MDTIQRQKWAQLLAGATVCARGEDLDVWERLDGQDEAVLRIASYSDPQRPGGYLVWLSGGPVEEIMGAD